MQKIKRYLVGVLLLAVIVAIFYYSIFGVVVVVKAIFASLMALDKNLVAAIIAACATIFVSVVTVFVSVVTVVYNQRKNKMREIAESHRPQKIKIYKQFMDKAVVGLLRSSKKKQTNTEKFQKDLEDLFFNFTGDVIVWGSPGVIKAYSAFRDCGEGDPRILLRLDDMLQEIRKDLGNSNWDLNQGNLIALFLTDPESLQKLT